MKIALVSPYDFSVPGGVNNHLLQLAAQFRRLGHEVRILAPASDPNQLVGNGIDVITIGRPIPIPTAGSIARIVVNPRLGGRITEVLERERFDIIHLHEPMMPTLPIKVLWASRSVNVGTFHAAKDGGNRFYSYSRFLMRRWLRALHGRIAVSPAAAALVGRYFPAHYDIIPNGLDVARYMEPAAPFPQYRDGKLNIVFVGRLEKRKGLKYLLRAYATLKRDFPGIRLIIVGDGRVRRGYETSVRKAGLRDVVFTGYVSEEQKIRYLHTADIFCAPNTGNESFGYVLAEAMAAGLPIVATNIPGFAYVVTHGEEGLLVRPKNERALAEALAALLRDPEMRARLTARGRERVRRFDWPHVARAILSYYERLLSQQEAAASRSAVPALDRVDEAVVEAAGPRG